MGSASAESTAADGALDAENDMGLPAAVVTSRAQVRAQGPARRSRLVQRRCNQPQSAPAEGLGAELADSTADQLSGAPEAEEAEQPPTHSSPTADGQEPLQQHDNARLEKVLSSEQIALLDQLDLSTNGPAMTEQDSNCVFRAFSQQEQRIEQGSQWLADHPLDAQADYLANKKLAASAFAENDSVYSILLPFQDQIRKLAQKHGIVETTFSRTRRQNKKKPLHVGQMMSELVQKLDAILNAFCCLLYALFNT